jgi:CheY-like chemotaxis protein
MPEALVCKRVLVVDDDFATQERLSMLLGSEGYRVATACNGVDALERLRAFERPELIILDLKMPKMDGCAFCEKRRQSPEWATIPLIVLSAAVDGAEVATALGASAYFLKPVDPLELLAALRQHCPVPALPV